MCLHTKLFDQALAQIILKSSATMFVVVFLKGGNPLPAIESGLVEQRIGSEQLLQLDDEVSEFSFPDLSSQEVTVYVIVSMRELELIVFGNRGIIRCSFAQDKLSLDRNCAGDGVLNSFL